MPAAPRAFLLLLLVALLGSLPALIGNEWQGTEARRVQIAVEMETRAARGEEGAWMVPTLGWEPTLAKPPLHCWVLAGVHRLLGTDKIWQRLPSVLAFWLLACLVWWILRSNHGVGAAWIGSLGVLCSPILLHGIPTAEIDPLFAACTGASVLLLAQGISHHRYLPLLAAGILGGLALLAKGPPLILFLWAPLLVWWRRQRLWGVAWFVPPLLLLPLCYYLPLVASFVDAAAFSRVAGEESVGRLLTFQWQNILETPIYLLRACALTLPLGLWTFHEYRTTRKAVVSESALLLRMCSAAAVGSVFLLTFFPGRPTRYLLPMVALFCVAVAPAVADDSRDLGRRGIRPLERRILHALAVLAAVTLVAAPFLPHPFPGRTTGLLALLALLPFLVRTRLHLVIAALAVPVVAAWTAFPDSADHRELSQRGLEPTARLLRIALDERGLTTPGAELLATRGHVHSAILLGLEAIPSGDEFRIRPPEHEWILHEEPDWDRHAMTRELTAYRQVLRVRGQGRTFVLRRRR